MSRVIAVIGGGQLARMMVPPSVDLNITLKTLVESHDSSAAQVTATSVIGDPNDLGDVLRLVEDVDVVTFEHEHIPQNVLAEIPQSVAVEPPASALRFAQDKLAMRRKLSEIDVPVPRWAMVKSPKKVRSFGKEVGWPIIAKAPVGGYDGKGVRLIEDEQAVDDWLADGPILVEEDVPFTRELAVLLARRPSGEIRFWPVVQTIQKDGVCSEVIAPAPDLSEKISKRALRIGEAIARELGVTGVLAVEMFVVESTGELFVNELAMRPHNSGHWTINGSVTSQFEQHLRAVLNLPLGDTSMRGKVWVMKNLLGTTYDDASAALPQVLEAVPEAYVHLYGKSVRPGRKLGHVNVKARTVKDAREQAARAIRILYGDRRA
ncbi:MAG: 5-(carboxyamino)imidazole ribonucleotide synthase [Actinomycetaceae bacterium]|nr:5-(carboxyamino)imidazole ribonucleotide synthase [Actinomycetaceae bacterium]